MKRKFIGLICVLAIISSFIACGEDKENDLIKKTKTEVTQQEKGKEEEEKNDKLDEEDDKSKDDEEKVKEENVLADYRFEIKVPEKWTRLPDSLVEAAGGGSVGANILGMWSVEMTTGATFGIATESGARGITLEQYKEAMKIVLETAGKDVEAKDRTFGNIDAIELKYVETQSAITFEITQVLIISDDNVIMIMLSEPENKDSNASEFEKVLGTLKEI
ncbi:MAG: hypothetical protein ACRCTZ_05210 [Sarcina sp.]